MHITEGVSKNYPSDSNFGISLKHTRRSRLCFGLFQSYRGWITLLTPDQVMCIICFIKWWHGSLSFDNVTKTPPFPDSVIDNIDWAVLYKNNPSFYCLNVTLFMRLNLFNRLDLIFVLIIIILLFPNLNLLKFISPLAVPRWLTPSSQPAGDRGLCHKLRLWLSAAISLTESAQLQLFLNSGEGNLATPNLIHHVFLSLATSS